LSRRILGAICSYAANQQIIFGGDNYSEERHADAEQRGLLNLRATPDALPYLISDETQALFSN
jgi:glutamine synthetase